MAKRSGLLRRTLTMALVGILPICASGATSSSAAKPDPRKFGMEYTITDGKLAACKVNGTLGDPDSDEAVCLLMERCVAEGNATQESAAVCIRPRLARMIELVNAGLLEELSATPEAAGADGVAPQEGDIVVQGRRLPRDGLWLVTESGYRMHHADMKVPIEQVYPRSWRRCIKGGGVEPILADLMRDDPAQSAGSPCPWKMTTEDGKVKGEQLCTRDGFTERGKLEGAYSETQLRLRKDVRVRRLFTGYLERRRQEMIDKYGDADEMGLENRTFSRGSRPASRGRDAEAIDRSNDQEFLQVTAYRVRNC